MTYLLLRVGPSRDLDDHVQDRLLLVGIQRDVVEGRDRDAILLDVNAVLERVRRADLAGREDGRGLALEAAAGGKCGSHGVLVSVLGRWYRKMRGQLRAAGLDLGANFVDVSGAFGSRVRA